MEGRREGRRRARSPIAGWAAEERGQSTVEYALVVLAFLAALVALGLMWHAVREGAFQRLSQDAASHSLAGGLAGLLRDIVLF